MEALKSGDNHKNVQLVHYVPGIGTRKFERFLGGVFGYGIGNYIKDAYSFIVSNYMPGDEIYLLGFSRGAYSARSLAGMIHNVGILQRRFLYLLNDAYDHYRSREKAWHPDAENSKTFVNNTLGVMSTRTFAFLACGIRLLHLDLLTG